MPYSRGRYFLTPPSLPLFAISVVIAIAALLVYYAGISIPVINASRVFDILAIAYVVLLAGVLVRQI
ncbi:MAG TPA: hypothetical protein VFY72_06330 [Beijerinckiaceae bacterium]|jgi:hypothetical protein|nr:hypothetical protein [Beijerinckiaceae bacterium]